MVRAGAGMSAKEQSSSLLITEPSEGVTVKLADFKMFSLCCHLQVRSGHFEIPPLGFTVWWLSAEESNMLHRPNTGEFRLMYMLTY